MVLFKISPQQLHDHLIVTNLSDVSEAGLQLSYRPNGPDIGIGEPDKDADPLPSTVRVELHEVLSKKNNQSVFVLFLGSIKVSLNEQAELMFDVTSAIRRWVEVQQRGETALQELQLSVHSLHPKLDMLEDTLISGLQGDHGGSSTNHAINADVLFLSHYSAQAAEQRSRRRKRHVLGAQFCKHSQVSKHICCLREIFIDFRENLKWNWIAKPQGYMANHCSGQCPYMWGSEDLHTTVLSLNKNLNPSAVAQPCCVAKDLDSISVAYRDRHGNYQVEILEGMVVTSCRCG